MRRVPDRFPPGFRLPGPALREASRHWKWKVLEAPAWKMLTSDHFVVRCDAPIEDLRESAACMEAFLGALRRSLGGDLPEARLSVRIFRGRAGLPPLRVAGGRAQRGVLL